jgi:hypothetical protein
MGGAYSHAEIRSFDACCLAAASSDLTSGAGESRLCLVEDVSRFSYALVLHMAASLMRTDVLVGRARLRFGLVLLV